MEKLIWTDLYEKTNSKPGIILSLCVHGANKPPANAELDEISKRAEELRKRDGRSKYKLVESDIYKTDPDPMPSNLKDQVRELLESRNSVETTTTQRDQDKSGYVTDVSTATWNFSTLDYSPRSVVSMNGARYDILKDDKPRSIMKRRELESREQLLFPTVDTQVVKSVVRKPTVTETVQRFEETRRTEEVERRVQRREKKERRSRHHSSSRHQSGWEGHTGGYQEHRVGAITSSLPRRQIIREADRAMTEEEMNKVVREAYAAADEARRDSRHRSSSLSRGGYLPGGQETYYRQETTRRQQHNNYDDNFNRGIAHARYGSLSDSLRRGELQYVPNGEVRQSFYRDGGASGGQRMHKSYSTRDVFTGDAHDDRRSVSSFHRRGSQQQVSPFVEFPPTLPRRGAGGDYRREEDAYFRPVSKSRSYADWDDAGRAGMGREVRRYDDDMSRLEAEFRDSLLMPMPNGNMNERDHRTEQLPGGYETFNKDRHANSGRRTGRDGKPVDFSEASQEYNYKREQTLNDDRRRRLTSFFVLTIATIIILNGANGVYQNSIFGLASELPFKYTNAVIIGNNLCGTFVTLLSMSTKAMTRNILDRAFAYFSIALITLIFCFISFLVLQKQRFYQFYSNRAETQRAKHEESAGNQGKLTTYIATFKEAFPMLINVFLVFFVTLSIFPGVMMYVKDEKNGGTYDFPLPQNYFMDVTTFLQFNVFAFIGSIVAGRKQWPSPNKLWIPVYLRLLYIPFFAFCNYLPETRTWPVFFESTWIFVIVAASMSFGSGYFSGLAMMYTSKSVDPMRAQVAGMMAGFFLISGIVSGLIFTMVIKAFVTA
ncbi:hypothetical protein L3Y34_000056 [Caenorhabditis briggsae]|uniref:Nucleoside transporter n=1 Tax=Caenorhabditis briggsae TaxID=6238 RepID=A0AAE9IMI0_CAEBR|nr:hypothetical protein L3Y34_000056 [Caenorhabditis briggsae]